MKNTTAIIVLTKFPQEGKVKTRLAKTIGNKQAAMWAKTFIKDLITTLRTTNVPTYFFLHPKEQIDEFSTMFDVSKNHIYPQSEGDLGEKIVHAIQTTLKTYNSVIVLGSDTPHIPKEYLEKTDKMLKTHDIVIGPSNDGGYYTIAMSKLHKELFTNIRWSSVHTLSDTRAEAKKRNLSVYTLPPLIDIDNFADLVKIYPKT